MLGRILEVRVGKTVVPRTEEDKNRQWWEGGGEGAGEITGSPGSGQSPHQEARKHGLFLRHGSSERPVHRCHQQDFPFLRTG